MQIKEKLLIGLLIVGMLPISQNPATAKDETDKIAYPCSVGHNSCGMAANFFNNTGDLQGEPLELKYTQSVRSDASDKWQKWNQAVVLELNSRLKAVKTRVDAKDKLLVSQITFTVSFDGKIIEPVVGLTCMPEPFHSRMHPRCPRPAFEKLALETLLSMNDSPCLQFPDGVQEKAISMSGTFSQNYGPKYISAKKEKPSF